MSPEDYKKAASDEKIGEAGMAKLRQICHPALKEVARCMEKMQVAGYQENILKELLEDIETDCKLFAMKQKSQKGSLYDDQYDFV